MAKPKCEVCGTALDAKGKCGVCDKIVPGLRDKLKKRKPSR